MLLKKASRFSTACTVTDSPLSTGDIAKSDRLLRQGNRPDPVAAFAFVEREKANYRVTRMCRVLGVSPSGYYAWRQRGPSRRAQRDVELLERIRMVHAKSRGIYGAPRIHAELRRHHQITCSRKRVARLMREANLVGVQRRRKQGSTRRDPARPSYADLVQREFISDTPDRLWVADITQHQTNEGWELGPKGRALPVRALSGSRYRRLLEKSRGLVDG